MMPEREQAVLLKAMHLLVGRQSSKRSIETRLLIKAKRMRQKCEALWHYCDSLLEVHSLGTLRTVRAASALDQREDRNLKAPEMQGLADETAET